MNLLLQVRWNESQIILEHRERKVTLLFSAKQRVPNVYAGAFFSLDDFRGKTYAQGDGFPLSSVYWTMYCPVIG